MSAIDNNAFVNGFPGTDALPDFGNSSAGAAPTARGAGWKDSIQPVMANPPCGAAAPCPEPSIGAPAGSSDGGLAGFGSFMNAFINALQNLLANLGRQPSASGQAYFANATSRSVGDPHDASEGTSGFGGTVDRKWNNMGSHEDLLDSDSFAGGYRVSTVATAKNDKGVTLNASASVALDGGATTISFNGDGSYAVTSNGQNVALVAGQATSLGNGESVTLGDGGSLSIGDTNAAGGSLATVLSVNRAGGVDVKNSASNVDLGGYLVDQSETPRYPLPAPRRVEAPDTWSAS